MTETVDKMKGIIDNANDPVTRDFEEHYISGVTKPEYELAKAKMREILVGYGGKDKIPEDVMPFYKAWSWKVYSYSKDAMLKNMEDMDKRRERHNLASDILDMALKALELECASDCKRLSARQITAFYTCMERGIIRGTENLELFVRKDPVGFYNFCSTLETELANEKNEGIKIVPILIYPTPKCGAWYGKI